MKVQFQTTKPGLAKFHEIPAGSTFRLPQGGTIFMKIVLSNVASAVILSSGSEHCIRFNSEVIPVEPTEPIIFKDVQETK